MIRTVTGAQRYNARMAKIFAQAKANNVKYAPRHLHQMLTRLIEKVERANGIQRSGGVVGAEDWSELFALTSEARAVLERIDIANLEGIGTTKRSIPGCTKTVVKALHIGDIIRTGDELYVSVGPHKGWHPVPARSTGAAFTADHKKMRRRSDAKARTRDE